MDRLKTSNDDAAVSYELTGGIGKSKATVDGKKSAISAFSKFLKSMLLPDYANMCAEIKGNVRNIGDLCDPTVFQKFATYLITFFLTKTNGTAKLGTILQYISGVVNQVYSDFPSNSTMIQSAIVGSWHTKLRDATTYDVTKRQINLGLNVKDDALPCGREVLKLVCSALLKVHYIYLIEVTDIHERSVLFILRTNHHNLI